MASYAGFLAVLSVVMLTFYNAPLVTSLSAPNKGLVNFLRLLVGTFNGSTQVSQDLQNHEAQVHTLTYMDFEPVKVPALASFPTFLWREVVSGKLTQLSIWRVSVDPDGAIRSAPYFVPNKEKYTYATPTSEILAALNDGNFKRNNDACDAIYSEIEDNVFFGSYPACLDDSNTNPEHYIGLSTCNALSLVPPGNAPESANPRPYVINLTKRNSLALFSDVIPGLSDIKDPCTCS